MLHVISTLLLSEVTMNGRTNRIGDGFDHLNPRRKEKRLSFYQFRFHIKKITVPFFSPVLISVANLP